MRSYPTCQDSRRPAPGFRLVLASHAGPGARVGEKVNVVTRSESQFTVSRPSGEEVGDVRLNVPGDAAGNTPAG